LLVHNLYFWRFFAALHPIATGAIITRRPLRAALKQRDEAAHVAMRVHIHAARVRLNALF